ncbi:MAG TPA: hypothetical protein VGV59_10165 [Pyrinomonadaceae bacterium]|nr:hypothetical protein [Pyrinomonadaceae bacterium]
MWTGVSLTIVFRGLLVIHKVVPEEGNPYFEIGVLPEEGHFLRINTIKNGVLAATRTLADRVNPRRPFWRLVVDNPLGGVSTHTHGEFDRESHPIEDDYRWVNDFNELFGDLTDKLDTGILEPVIRIPHGVFYTRLKSPPLSKLVDETAEPFGAIAAVTGCDIPMFGGGARLEEATTGNLIFDFAPEANTIYELTNTPPDVEVEHEHEHGCPHCGCPHHLPEHDHANTNARREGGDERASQHGCEGDHFRSYYRLFKNPDAEPQICFVRPGPAPAPDPALCGVIHVSQPNKPFGSDA